MNNCRVFRDRKIGMLITNNSKKATIATGVRKTTSGALGHAQEPSYFPGVKGSWQESRPEKVARAKRLLKNPYYPSPKVINAIARLMAKHLT